MQHAPQPDTSAPQQQHSALLQCLSQLNSDAWAQVLLPKLVEQESAANVANTCSQLRDLCFSSKQKLNFSDLLAETAPSNLVLWTQHVPTHFPNCTSVSFKLSKDSSYHAVPYLLPALARLQHLNELSVVSNTETEPLFASTMLFSMRMQLPSLRSLTFPMRATQTGFAMEEFGELGRFTQLKQLQLDLQDTETWTYAAMERSQDMKTTALQQLSGLTQLQDLVMCAVDWDDWTGGLRKKFGARPRPILAPQLLSSLTALTRLESNVFCVESLACVTSCVGLQRLGVCVSSASMQLPPAEWTYLAQLTGLKSLRLMNAALCDATPEACAALSSLKRLELIAAAKWRIEFMPALVVCAQLTAICGEWEDQGQGAGVSLPKVLALSGAGRTPPVQYLPNLRHFQGTTCVDGCPSYDFCIIPASGLQLLCMHCTSLRELVLTAHWGSLAPEGDDGELPALRVSVAAIQALTSLQHLTSLHFTPNDDHELVALVTACSVLEGHSLQELRLSEGGRHYQHYPEGSPSAWLQLARLRQLRHLTLQLTCEKTVQYYTQTAEAAMLVSALSGCKHVSLELPKVGANVAGQLALEGAAFVAVEAGLPAPEFDFIIHNWSY